MVLSNAPPGFASDSICAVRRVRVVAGRWSSNPSGKGPMVLLGDGRFRLSKVPLYYRLSEVHLYVLEVPLEGRHLKLCLAPSVDRPQHVPAREREREFFIDNLLVRIHRCFWCTGLAPWEFESPFPGSLISTFLTSSSRSKHKSNAPGLDITAQLFVESGTKSLRNSSEYPVQTLGGIEARSSHRCTHISEMRFCGWTGRIPWMRPTAVERIWHT